MTKVVLMVILILAAVPWGEAMAARKALVIGVGEYEHFNDLSTPPADARVFAEALQRFGFAVQQPSGSDIDSLKDALDTFLRSLKRQDEALFFFSGHGMQREGDNFLFATDSQMDEFSSIVAINNDAINVTQLVQEMERRTALALVFLDACRTIQLPGNKSLGDAKGFTFKKVEVQQQASFIGFAAQENQSAFTSNGALSYYTAALVAALNNQALAREPLPQLYSHVRHQVREATQESQLPDYRNRLGNRQFHFATPTSPPPPPPVAGPTGASLESSLGLTRAERRLIQLGLAAEGFDPGPADGWIGEKTRTAIGQWQTARGKASTGYLDPDAAKALLAFGTKREAQERARQAAAEAERQRRERQPDSGTRLRDCDTCPELVVVPAGSFTMGSPSYEEGRDDDEGPLHRVTIKQPVAVGVHEVTRGEFARFVWDANRSMGNACYAWGGSEWVSREGLNWLDPGFRQTDDDPVVCVSWSDAQAYVSWLSRQTGKRYRLLSESEWEYVARAGTTTSRYWGDSTGAQCRYANGADRTAKRQYSGWTVAECDDGVVHTAPVGSFTANNFALHDVLGNVWEWTQDCWHDSYTGAPGDGRAWERGDCSHRVVRGGSWGFRPRSLRAADRGWGASGVRYGFLGFRIARTLTP